MKYRTSVGHRLLLLVACQTVLATLLVGIAVRILSNAAAGLENHSAMQQLNNGRLWLIAIGIGGALLTWGLGLHVTLAIAPRIRVLVSHVRQFQECGTHEKIGDSGRDDIAVLGNAIDAGFSAIASREQDRAQFLAVAAHELKTPVATIQGYASFLATQSVVPVDTARALQVINRQSWRLSRLIEMLFLAARARTGTLIFEPKPLDMSLLVRRVLQEIQPYLSRRVFASRITDHISILGDEALLEHALWCLFTCAAALSNENAPIEIALSDENCASLSVDILPNGMSSLEVQELFLPFRSLQYETAGGPRYPIGLYLCREIVRVHNGRLRVSPIFEVHPEFLMELPI